jgi:hypothetical protein
MHTALDSKQLRQPAGNGNLIGHKTWDQLHRSKSRVVKVIRVSGDMLHRVSTHTTVKPYSISCQQKGSVSNVHTLRTARATLASLLPVCVARDRLTLKSDGEIQVPWCRHLVARVITCSVFPRSFRPCAIDGETVFRYRALLTSILCLSRDRHKAPLLNERTLIRRGLRSAASGLTYMQEGVLVYAENVLVQAIKSCKPMIVRLERVESWESQPRKRVYKCKSCGGLMIVRYMVIDDTRFLQKYA